MKMPTVLIVNCLSVNSHDLTTSREKVWTVFHWNKKKHRHSMLNVNIVVQALSDLPQRNSGWVLAAGKFTDLLTVVQSHVIALT